LQLLEDPDLRFRPCPALLEVIDASDRDPSCLRPVYSLDRPIVPVLNAFFAVGLITTTSCAGHLPDDVPSPHVALRDVTTRSLEAIRLVAQMLPRALIEHWVYIQQGVQREGLVLHWGVDRLDDRHGFGAPQLEELDRAVLDAAERFQSEVGALPEANASTPEIDLLRVLAAEQRVDGSDLWLTILERPELLRLSISTWGKDSAVPTSLLERSAPNVAELKRQIRPD